MSQTMLRFLKLGGHLITSGNILNFWAVSIKHKPFTDILGSLLIVFSKSCKI